MILERIEFIENKNIFVDESDKYIEINFRRENRDMLTFTYKYEEFGYYIYIGCDGRINGIEILYKPSDIFLENEEEIIDKPNIKGEGYIEIPYYEIGAESIKERMIFRKLKNNGYILFYPNSDVEYILTIDDNLQIAVCNNNKICGIINYDFVEIKYEIKRNKF